MTVETNLVAAIETQFSAEIGDRVFPGFLPEGVTYPAMRYMVISDPEIGTLQGTSKLSHPRIQFTYWGPNAGDMQQFRDDFRNYLSSYSDALIQGIKILNAPWGADPEADLYFCHIDLEVWYTRE